jgi:hypothetical protein
MGFEDMFQGVSFQDATIKTDGMPAGGTQDAGKAGTPAPAQGQSGGSPTAPANQTAGTQGSETPGAKSDKGTGLQDAAKTAEGGEKPAPYDKDPKWLKARAAEAALDAILKESGLLDAEELKAELAKGRSLAQILGNRDPKKVIEDAEYAAKVRQRWDQDKRAKSLENETPEARIARLEKENEDLRRSSEDYRSGVESREHAQKVVQNFGSEVDRVISAITGETPLPAHENELLKLFLGVDNPANLIDIEDQVAVRKMARDGITKFQTLVQKIKQAAIDEYAAGKSKLTVDTTKGGSADVQTGMQKAKLPPNATVDQAFEAANAQFLEILQKGLQASDQL